jgi:hypothetical protein
MKMDTAIEPRQTAGKRLRETVLELMDKKVVVVVVVVVALVIVLVK